MKRTITSAAIAALLLVTLTTADARKKPEKQRRCRLPEDRFGFGMLDALGEAVGKDNPHAHHGGNN